MSRWCGSCQRDVDAREETGRPCTIALATMALDTDEVGYPEQWIQAERGPVCTAWKPHADPGAGPIDDMRQKELRLG